MSRIVDRRVRLASKPLPPLQHNRPLKGLLRRVDELGYVDDALLGAILKKAGNISSEEDHAIRAVVEAGDVERRASDEAWGHFQNELELEAGARKSGLIIRWRNAFARGLSGAAAGLAAGAAGAPAVAPEHQTLVIVSAAVIGAYYGLKDGLRSEYGVND
ncbi:MAG: hypothetical protein IT384_18105 [Deltaproteobacteria bacterium]|nr:hypothetical protein [Deltaproteobacteria bacterium]